MAVVDEHVRHHQYHDGTAEVLAPKFLIRRRLLHVMAHTPEYCPVNSLNPAAIRGEISSPRSSVMTLSMLTQVNANSFPIVKNNLNYEEVAECLNKEKLTLISMARWPFIAPPITPSNLATPQSSS